MSADIDKHREGDDMSWIIRRMTGRFFKGMINPLTLGAGTLMVVLFLSRRPERVEIMPYSRYVELQQREDVAFGMPSEPADEQIPPDTPIRVWSSSGYSANR